MRRKTLVEQRMEQFDRDLQQFNAEFAAAMRAWLAASPDNTREEGLRIFLAELHRRKEEIERASHGNRRLDEVLK